MMTKKKIQCFLAILALSNIGEIQGQPVSRQCEQGHQSALCVNEHAQRDTATMQSYHAIPPKSIRKSNVDTSSEYENVVQESDNQYLDDNVHDEACQYLSDDDYSFCNALEEDLSREEPLKTIHAARQSPLTPLEKMERLARAIKSKPSPFVSTISDTWMDYIPRYIQADQAITKAQARYRIFTKLTKEIATKLTSRNSTLMKEAATQLSQLERRSNFKMGKEKRDLLHARLQDYFGLANKSCATRITGLGMPTFPVERIEELFDTDKNIHGPALRHLYELAKQEKKSRKQRSKGASISVVSAET